MNITRYLSTDALSLFDNRNFDNLDKKDIICFHEYLLQIRIHNKNAWNNLVEDLIEKYPETFEDIVKKCNFHQCDRYKVKQVTLWNMCSNGEDRIMKLKNKDKENKDKRKKLLKLIFEHIQSCVVDQPQKNDDEYVSRSNVYNIQDIKYLKNLLFKVVAVYEQNYNMLEIVIFMCESFTVELKDNDDQEKFVQISEKIGIVTKKIDQFKFQIDTTKSNIKKLWRLNLRICDLLYIYKVAKFFESSNYTTQVFPEHLKYIQNLKGSLADGDSLIVNESHTIMNIQSCFYDNCNFVKDINVSCDKVNETIKDFKIEFSFDNVVDTMEVWKSKLLSKENFRFEFMTYYVLFLPFLQ